jgi:molecular chaperone DnaJ
MAQDYYEVLGVARTADKAEIKKAFRQLARQYHPDVSQHPEAETRFKEINEAYEVLSDDEKRARYDRFGHAGVQNGAGGFSTSFTGFEEIFEEFFSGFGGAGFSTSGRTTRRGPRPGQDRKVAVTVTFEEAVFGVEKEIAFDRMDICSVCQGSGAEPGTTPTRCPTCNGSGSVSRVQETFIGPMRRVTTCPQCHGRGQVISNPCHQCRGEGRERHHAVLNVQIPPGVREGLQIQVRSEGDAGEPGAPNGNLYVVIQVEEHAYFKRRNNDIILDISLNVAQAALGDVIRVPTVDGEIDLTVPAGTQTGKVFRLRGKGVPRLRSDGSTSGRGDQLIYVQVAVPTQLTEKQRQLFEELAKSLGTGNIQPQGGGRGFFDRVMDFFAGEQQQQ